MTSPDLTSLFITNTTIRKPEKIWNPGSGVQPFIFNNDTVNTLFVGPKRDTLAQNQSSCIPIPPLGGQSWPDTEIWAFAPIAVNLLIIPGASSWAPSPVQVQLALNAAGLMKDTTGQTINGTLGAPAQDPTVSGLPGNIAVTGVPLLRFENTLANTATGSLAPGASSTVGPFSVNSTSYELMVTITGASLQAIMNGQITLQWFNSAGTVELARKTFSAVASTSGHKVSITGPVRGSQLKIIFTNSSVSLANITFSYTLLATSRLAANDLFRTLTNIGTNPPSLQTWSGLQGDAGMLGNATPSVGAGATAVRGLAAYNGPVEVTVVTNSGTSDCEIIVGVIDTTIAVNNGTVFRDFTNGKGRSNPSFNLPMAQCQIQVTNNNAGAQTISINVTTDEPNVN